MTGPGLDGPLVTVERAAQLLCCSRSRVYELLAQCRLTRAQSFGRRTVILTQSVLDLAACTPPAAPKPPKKRGRPPKADSQRVAEARAAFRRGLEG